MNIIKRAIIVITTANLSACAISSVELEHATEAGLTKTCRNAFFDWHAASHMVDYFNHKCAQQAIKQGYVLKANHLAEKDFTIPAPPTGKIWNESVALSELKADRISERKYGYILGMLEMTYRDTVAQAAKDRDDGKIDSAEFEAIKQAAKSAFYGSSEQ